MPVAFRRCWLRRSFTILMVSVLVSGGVQLLLSRPASAQVSVSYYFPWVPHGEVVNGQGPWYADLAFQNLTSELCSVVVSVGQHDGEGWRRTSQLTVGANGSRTLSSASLAIPEPGAPVRLDAYCTLSASLKLFSPEPRTSPWSNGAHVVAGYSSYTNSDIQAAISGGANTWYLPIVQTNSQWNSIIRVANYELTRSIQATIELTRSAQSPASGPETQTITRSIEPGTTASVDVLAELGTRDWVGYATIKSNGLSGTMVLRSKPSASMAVINMGQASSSSTSQEQYRLGAPLLFTNYNDWNTGINIANVSEQPAHITISYSSAAGNIVRTDELDLAPRAMTYLYTPASVDQDDFVGSASIVSNAPIVAAIDEVKYTSVDAISYLASAVGQQQASVPLVFRSDPDAGLHDNSGLNLHSMNPDSSQTVSIELFSINGVALTDQPISLTLPPAGNNYIYIPETEEVPNGSLISARITTTDALGFIGLANDVNYAVAGDGSATFMITSDRGTYHLSPSSFR